MQKNVKNKLKMNFRKYSIIFRYLIKNIKDMQEQNTVTKMNSKWNNMIIKLCKSCQPQLKKNIPKNRKKKEIGQQLLEKYINSEVLHLTNVCKKNDIT